MKTQQRRATVYLDPRLHRALRLKAAETDRSVSEIVNDAVRSTLADEAEDLAAFEKRAHERRFPLEQIFREMKKRGQL